jgi:PII-like signaling protein
MDSFIKITFQILMNVPVVLVIMEHVKTVLTTLVLCVGNYRASHYQDIRGTTLYQYYIIMSPNSTSLFQILMNVPVVLVIMEHVKTVLTTSCVIVLLDIKEHFVIKVND